MTAFQNTKEQTEQKVTVNLLSEIENNPRVTQRHLAQKAGIALGLMNQYLKRCISKGWVRASQVSPKRISYFLTPEGFYEKSLMVRDSLAYSLTFFRDAKAQCQMLLDLAVEKGWGNLTLLGEGDLADICMLVSKGMPISLGALSQIESKDYDAVLITDIKNPQKAYEQAKKFFPEEKILTPDLLHISRSRP